MAIPDPPIETRPFQFVRAVVFTTAEWPTHTRLPEEWLAHAHAYGGTVEGDVLTLTIGNGKAKYQLHRDDVTGEGILAEMVEGDTPGRLRQKRKKYEQPADEDV